MWRGYWGEVAMSPKNVGGLGGTAANAHLVLVVVEEPIAIFLVLGIIGFFVGGMGYLLPMHSKA